MLADDPDDVLRGLRIWPEVVVYGSKLFSMNNRRTYCIKHCNVPQEARISVKLYASPEAYDSQYINSSPHATRMLVAAPHAMMKRRPM